MMFRRHPENPIVVPGIYPWRMAAVFNPGVLYEDGRFFMYERAAGQLRPFHCSIGMLEIDDIYYMTYAFRPYAWNSHPTGVGVPDSFEPSFPGFSGRSEDNMTRSGIAVSEDRIHWRHHSWPTPKELDD